MMQLIFSFVCGGGDPVPDPVLVPDLVAIPIPLIKKTFLFFWGGGGGGEFLIQLHWGTIVSSGCRSGGSWIEAWGSFRSMIDGTAWSGERWRAQVVGIVKPRFSRYTTAGRRLVFNNLHDTKTVSSTHRSRFPPKTELVCTSLARATSVYHLGRDHFPVSIYTFSRLKRERKLSVQTEVDLLTIHIADNDSRGFTWIYMDHLHHLSLPRHSMDCHIYAYIDPQNICQSQTGRVWAMDWTVDLYGISWASRINMRSRPTSSTRFSGC